MRDDESFETLAATLLRLFSPKRGEGAEAPRPPTPEEVASKARELAPLLGFHGDIDLVVSAVLPDINVRMGIGVSLIDVNADHDPEWVRRVKDWTYTKNYSRYLQEEDWSGTVVGELERVTESILSLLQDPEVSGDWDRRGLVIGHVQSGKTANYLGLVARAADAGYRFIVIVAGIHNNLRSQTQARVDEGFVGRNSDPADQRAVGVGRYSSHSAPVALTTVMDDFKQADAARLRSGLADWQKPVVLVIKKNTKVLEQILNWLRTFNLQVGQDSISDVPMLFIDDEADNASVNTRKPELDPTRTNALIRQILTLFRKSCYVGYTATPFANIFINPEAYDDETRDDLFPRDFIYCLDAPTSYFGADRIFLSPEAEAQHLRTIRDAEDIIPLKHKIDLDLQELPASLKRAIRQFVLARAIRNLRGQSGKHCSMLINVSRFVAVQKNIRVLVKQYVELLKQAIQTNYRLPPERMSGNTHMAALRSEFLEEFGAAGETWDEVLAELHTAVESIKLFVVNSSKSDELLDYAAYEREGKALTAIAIGGLSLSRGLTIEGLTISYMYRNTRMYDTLMQMGRWFGYRKGYEDLCRVWLSEESINWYAHIAQTTEELRESLKLMRRHKRTPRDFGLRVQSHPDALMVTAANKMQHAESRTVSVTLDGMLRESFVLSDDPDVHSRNRKLMASLYSELSEKNGANRFREGEMSASAFWREVPVDVVSRFIHDFEWHPHHAQLQEMCVKYIERIRSRFPTADVAFVSLENTRGKPFDMNDFSMIAQERSPGTERDGKVLLKPASASGYFASGRQRVSSTKVERVGLNADQMKAARSLAESQGRTKGPTDSDFRSIDVRGRPLLMIHLIDIKERSGADDSPSLLENAPAIAIAFPATGDFERIDYVVNRVFMEQQAGDVFDLPEDDEDQD